MVQEGTPYWLQEERIEPFWTIRRTSLLFTAGILFVAGTAGLIGYWFYDLNRWLAMGLQVGLQAVGFSWVFAKCRQKAESKQLTAPRRRCNTG